MCSMVGPLPFRLQGALQAALAPLHASWQGCFDVSVHLHVGQDPCCRKGPALVCRPAGGHACR